MDTSERIMNESANPKPESMLGHAGDIMRAAFPFLDSDSQKSISLLIKMDELFQTFRHVKDSNSLTALSVRKQSIDIEALLRGIREICYPPERRIIDMILNFFQAKKLFDTYSAISGMMASQPDMAENMGSMFGMDSNANMSEMLESLLTPEQKSTFDNMSMIFNMMQQE